MDTIWDVSMLLVVSRNEDGGQLKVDRVEHWRQVLRNLNDYFLKTRDKNSKLVKKVNLPKKKSELEARTDLSVLGVAERVCFCQEKADFLLQIRYFDQFLGYI